MKDKGNIEITFSNMEQINFLATAESRKEYHELLSELILLAPRLNHEELSYLSNILKHPAKFPKGPKRKYMRDVMVFEKYFVQRSGKPLLPRLEIIQGMMADFKISFDAARKTYDRLRPKATKKMAKAALKKNGK